MKAVYAGSFDPFTNGHLDIVREASRIFDKVIILISNNSEKTRKISVSDMKRAISATLVKEKLFNCKVVQFDGMVVDYCTSNDIEYIVRGLRSANDYLYEENIAKINREVNPKIRTIYLRAQNDAISSSMVRELHKYGKSVAEYLPEAVLKLY